jgi:hypothetical protein
VPLDNDAQCDFLIDFIWTHEGRIVNFAFLKGIFPEISDDDFRSAIGRMFVAGLIEITRSKEWPTNPIL